MSIPRRLVLFGAPLMVAAVNFTHPIYVPPMLSKIAPELHHWLHIHFLNLLLFPLMGLAAYFLVNEVHGTAATVAKLAVALFIPVYAAFDALAGIGMGVLVASSLHSSGGASDLSALIDAYWTSPIIAAIAVIGSMAWVIAMLATAVAYTAPERRKLIAAMAILVFLVAGWSRGNIFLAPNGVTIRGVWWLVAVVLTAVMCAAGRPRVPAGLLTLAGILFGAYHVPPTGPLGALCFLSAALYLKLGARERQTTKVAASAASP